MKIRKFKHRRKYITLFQNVKTGEWIVRESNTVKKSFETAKDINEEFHEILILVAKIHSVITFHGCEYDPIGFAQKCIIDDRRIVAESIIEHNPR